MARTIFEFRLNENGFIAGGSEWTDEQTYQNGKFSALENGVAISQGSAEALSAHFYFYLQWGSNNEANINFQVELIRQKESTLTEFR